MIEILCLIFLFSDTGIDVYICELMQLNYYDNSLYKITYTLFTSIYIYGNIVTVKRCNYIGLKKYNFIAPVFQIIIFIISISLMVFGAIGENIEILKPITIIFSVIKFIEVLYLSVYFSK
jgi:hypothetical protein